jgi:murein DD-endopeptidase MepM/ murein hydrolase activator NlpD
MPKKWIAGVLLLGILFSGTRISGADGERTDTKSYIKWVDFTVPAQALEDAMNVHLDTRGSDCAIDWIELLAFLGVRYGGDFSRYKTADLTDICKKINPETDFCTLSKNEKAFAYYKEAYGAVLGGMLGPYREITSDGGWEEGYGLRAYSPIARGFGYSHFDDFGATRSYGYKRKHLGHDLMGGVGTPIIAVEGGYVEACGWNQYGGWRLGIRSFDGKRYYYYAHLRKNHPYTDMYEGKTVDAGEVIGYLGMTGYSRKENTNNIDTPHLHYGMQLIFDPSQKDGWNQIWIDMYELTKFLARQTSSVYRGADGEYHAKAVRIPSDSWE